MFENLLWTVLDISFLNLLSGTRLNTWKLNVMAAGSVFIVWKLIFFNIRPCLYIWASGLHRYTLHSLSYSLLTGILSANTFVVIQLFYNTIFYYQYVFVCLDTIILMIYTPLDEPWHNSHHSETYLCEYIISLPLQLSIKLNNVKYTRKNNRYPVIMNFIKTIFSIKQYCTYYDFMLEFCNFVH